MNKGKIAVMQCFDIENLIAILDDYFRKPFAYIEQADYSETESNLIRSLISAYDENKLC